MKVQLAHFSPHRVSSILVLLGAILILTPSCKHKIGEDLKNADGDELLLIDGLEAKVLISAGTPLTDDKYYGYNNGGLALIPEGSGEATLWVGFESINPILVSGYDANKRLATRDRQQINEEIALSGGALIALDRFFGKWGIEDDGNIRITADQEIPFEWPEPVRGATKAKGTVAHGQAVVTPWGTILSCENDYYQFYAGQNYVKNEFVQSRLGWESFTQVPSTHFGYIVEVDPKTGASKKHVGLGRFPHGGISLVPLADGRVVVYSTDNRAQGALYKFISDEPNQLYPGKLYVANASLNTWMEIDYNQLSEGFDSPTDMMIKTAKAAKMIGATSFPFPAGLAFDSNSGEVFMAIQGDTITDCGRIMSLRPENGNHEALDFQLTALTLGAENGLCRPKGLFLDEKNNLWISSQIRSNELWEEPVKAFGNNGLFVKLNTGSRKGELVRVATAPADSNFGGMCFSPNGKTLFITVQNVGDRSETEKISSAWNMGEGDSPRPALVAITGGFLQAIKE